MAFVLDASVAISWCFPGNPSEDTPYSRRVVKDLAINDAVVPEIWAFEIANSIFVSFDLALRSNLAPATSDESLQKAAMPRAFQ
jgi:hypothetical protein